MKKTNPTKDLFGKDSGQPVKLSRSKLELFLQCPRCFWLDLHHIAKRPPMAPYTINNAIDQLLKQEFDESRESNLEHYLIKKYQLDAHPYKSEHLAKWRHNFTGVQHRHDLSGFLVYGAVDDVWESSRNELIVVDFKATGAKEHKIYDSYKRQMEIYQWLLKQNGYQVSDTGYFLFAKVDKSKKFVAGQLHFDLLLEPCRGGGDWVEGKILEARSCYDAGAAPEPTKDCGHCEYVKSAE